MRRRLTDAQLRNPRGGEETRRRIFPIEASSHLNARPKADGPKPVVFLSNGVTLSQGLVSRRRRDPRPSSPLKHSVAESADGGEEDADDLGDTMGDFHDDFDPQSTSIFFPSDRPTSPMKKPIRENQWHAWTYDIIPALVPVYMQLLHKTESLRNTEDLTLPGRPCCKCNKRTLAIAVVRMTRTSRFRSCICWLFF